MGFMDVVKQRVTGKKPQIKDGVDKAANVVGGKVGAQHADKVDKAAGVAKDVVDKLPD